MAGWGSQHWPGLPPKLHGFTTVWQTEQPERPGKFLHAPENGLGISWESWLDVAENSGPRDHRLCSNEKSYSLVLTTQQRAAADQGSSFIPNTFNRGLPRRERPWRKAWIERFKGKKVRKHVWDLIFLEMLVFHFLRSINIKHKMYFLHRASWLGWGIQAEIRVYSDRAGGGPKPCYSRCGPRQSSWGMLEIQFQVSS